MGISVCIITKNEAAKLEECLKALKAYNFETVVVDTGSEDDTQSVIKKYADVGGYFEWCDDFAKARNYAASLAGNEWILALDSDEKLQYCDEKKLWEMLAADEMLLGRIELINVINSTDGVTHGTESLCRLYNRKYYEFRGRIHEQIDRIQNQPADSTKNLPSDRTADSTEKHITDQRVDCTNNPPSDMPSDQPSTHEALHPADKYVNLPISVLHTGYMQDGEQRRKKTERNIRLLKRELEERGADPYILYQLGKSYFMRKEYEEACRYFEEGFAFDLDPALVYVQDMVETYGYALINLKRYDEMLFLEQIYDAFAVSADYMFLMGLAYMNNERFEDALREFVKASECKTCKVEGTNSYKALYNAGVICECTGKLKEAAGYYKKCGIYKPAADGLERVGKLLNKC